MNIKKAKYSTPMKEKLLLLFGIRKGGKSFDRYSLYFVLIALLLTLVLGLEEYYTKLPPLLWWGFYILIAGVILRTTARIQLGKLFTFNVKIMQDHTIKQDGLYKYVRHPGYTGILLEVIGFCIFLQSFWAALTTILLVIPSGYYRIKVEEKTLEENLPGYIKYKRKVKAVIPFLF